MAKKNDRVVVESTSVSCDGGDGALGHPKVYLYIGSKKQVECPYCGRLFVLKSSGTDKKDHEST